MIIGTGAYVPDEVITNDYLEGLVDTSDEWIKTRTGISERRRAASDAAVSDLALPASMQALEAANVAPEELELIVVATITPDTYCPSAACWLQSRLGAKRAFAFDVNAACSGFVYGLSVADQFIRSGSVQRALFVGAEIMTRVVNWKDRATCVLWGDGAGAVVLAPSENGRGILSSHLYSDGSNGETLTVDGRFAVAREGSLQFKTQLLGKGIMSKVGGGEGCVNVISGTGKVLLSPVPTKWNTILDRNLSDLIPFIGS